MTKALKRLGLTITACPNQPDDAPYNEDGAKHGQSCATARTAQHEFARQSAHNHYESNYDFAHKFF